MLDTFTREGKIYEKIEFNPVDYNFFYEYRLFQDTRKSKK